MPVHIIYRVMYVRRNKYSVKIRALIIIFVFVSIGMLISFAERSVRPILQTMAKANVEIIAGEKISEAIEEEMMSEQYDLDNIISFEKDTDGRINAVKTNRVLTDSLSVVNRDKDYQRIYGKGLSLYYILECVGSIFITYAYSWKPTSAFWLSFIIVSFTFILTFPIA